MGRLAQAVDKMLEWIKAKLAALAITNLLFRFLRKFVFDGTVFLGLFIFLWSFYCGIAERIFASHELVNPENIINTLAYRNILDLVIVFFPFIFFGISVLIHRYWGVKKVVIPAITVGLLLDYTVALVSSNNIHHYRSANDENYAGLWNPLLGGVDYVGHVSIVMLCGIGGSIILGCIYRAIKLEDLDKLENDENGKENEETDEVCEE